MTSKQFILVANLFQHEKLSPSEDIWITTLFLNDSKLTDQEEKRIKRITERIIGYGYER